jgi:transmembrane sensor
MTENNIPENDRDKFLARQYDKVLRGDIRISEITDPFLHILLKVRNEEERVQAAIPVRGQQSGWAGIYESISKNNENRPSNVTHLFSSKKWAWAAAAVALIVFSFILLLLQTTETGPQLIAESGSTITAVELTDGSRVTLRPNSRIYELSLTETDHSYSLSGEALIEVEPVSGRTFSVQAGPGRVRVTGTRFNLSDWDQKSSVYLLDGEIIFESVESEESVQLSAGNAAVINEENRLLEPFTFEADEITGWIQNRLTFRDREAVSIFTELEFHFNIHIDAPDQIRSESLGGSIPLSNAEQALEDLGTVLGGRFEQTGGSSYQFIPEQ